MWSPVGPALSGDSLSLARRLCPQHENAGGCCSRPGVGGNSFLLLTCHRRALEQMTSPAEPLGSGAWEGEVGACAGLCDPAGKQGLYMADGCLLNARQKLSHRNARPGGWLRL